ncbi:phosphatase PAP2 family protein [Ruegeria sp.]|uniref:phosphatase PAP2 family protein n=1 Tax=Ruegeria sp. TaxID=1879320 RepID=UPI003C7E4D51
MFKSSELPTSGLFLPGVLWRNRLLATIAGLHLCFGIAVSIYVGASFWSETALKIWGVTRILTILMLASFFSWRFAYAIFAVKPKKPIQWMIADTRRLLSDRDRLADTITGLACAVVVIVTFSYIKGEIPAINPYTWDPIFAQLDRLLHGGQDPWRLLWPVLGHPYITTLLNVVYIAWFVLCYLAVCVACIDRRDPTRSTVFLVAFALCWVIGGNLLAIIFASVGPVYFDTFGFGDQFVPLVDLLHASHDISPVWALEIHQMLLDGHFNDGPVRGISAMPSMHVATSVMVAIYGFTYKRWLGWVLTGFALLIMLGSVQLAWHYAVDGYAAAVLALGLWWVAKTLTARFGPST